jgi:hypothetical protein
LCNNNCADRYWLQESHNGLGVELPRIYYYQELQRVVQISKRA